MLAESEPLKWWEKGGVRRSVVIAFGICVLLSGLGLLPDVEKFYGDHPDFKHILDGTLAVLGLGAATLELIHAKEANKYRAERNQIAREANELARDAKDFQAKATAAQEKTADLQQETVQLQARVHGLQKEIERRITKVRLWVRAHKGANAAMVVLRVSNLSDFDLWINQARLIVTKPSGLISEPEVFGGANSISRGKAEEGYPLYGSIVKINADRTDKIDINFRVEVEAVGVVDESVTVKSPEYELQVRDGRVTKLEVISRFE
jgi:hypothetical protein